MRELAGRSDHLARAIEAIVSLSEAANAPELLDRLIEVTASIGATASLYCTAIPETGGEPSSFSLFGCDPAFAFRQDRLGPLLDHPWFRFACAYTMPGTDRQIPLRHAGDVEAVEIARGYGFMSCLIVPTPAGTDLARTGMLCLGCRQADEFEREDTRIVWTLARSLAAELHEWVTRHLSQVLRHAAKLVEADIQLLRLERQGFSTKEISRRTGMTCSSVNSRFQRLNGRLDCANRGASARRAAEYGLLELPRSASSHGKHD